MVDVGYFINGKHGVIWNCEIHDYSDTMKYIRFERGNEIYVIQYKEIEYIIPSDVDCVSGKIVFDKDGVTEYGADGSVVMKGRYVEDDEGKFDYNVVYTIDGVMRYHSVSKSKLADVIEDAFANGGYGMSIGCVERKNDNT